MNERVGYAALVLAAIVLLPFCNLLWTGAPAPEATGLPRPASAWAGSEMASPIRLEASKPQATVESVASAPQAAPVLEPDPEEQRVALLRARLSEAIGTGQPRGWKSIVFHHSATTKGDLAAFDQYHRTHFGDPNGVKYHFVIGNGSYSGDGEIEITDRWRRQILAAHNHYPENAPDSLAINLVGNFEEGAPTAAQFKAAVRLARVLCETYGLSAEDIRTHRIVDRDCTLCPGKHFPYEDIRAAVQAAMQLEIQK